MEVSHDLGILLFHAAAHDVIDPDLLLCLEDINMGQVNDPYVLKLELEYRFLQQALKDQIARFSEYEKEHKRMIDELSRDITKKFCEYQTAKLDAKKYMKENCK